MMQNIECVCLPHEEVLLAIDIMKLRQVLLPGARIKQEPRHTLRPALKRTADGPAAHAPWRNYLQTTL